MKFIVLLVGIFLVAFVGQTFADLPAPPYLFPSSETEKPTTSKYLNDGPTPPLVITTPGPTNQQNPCGSNNLGDYKGGCDESVPVIVIPKGRPVMERVLEWFKCGTEMCLRKRR